MERTSWPIFQAEQRTVRSPTLLAPTSRTNPTALYRWPCAFAIAPKTFHRSPFNMTLRKASTVILFAASFVAVAGLSAARVAAAMPALSIIASVARPMASGGSDATAKQGVALASMLREDEPVFTAADWAAAVSVCTKLAAQCKTAATGTGVERKLQDCLNCKNICNYAFDLTDMMNRPLHELKRWNILAWRCVLKAEKLMERVQKTQGLVRRESEKFYLLHPAF